MNRTISLSALTVLDLPPHEMVRCAADNGYDAIGLRLIPASDNEPVWPTIGRTPMIETTRRQLEDSGIPVLDIEIVRLSSATKVSDFEAFLETGAYLGASQILVAGMDDDRARLAANFAALAELSAGYGLTPNLEFMPWTAVATLADAAEVLSEAAHPNVGLLIDSLHYNRSHSDAELIDSLPPSWFHYSQLCDAPAAEPKTTSELIRQARSARLVPGAGELDLLTPLRHLPAELPIGVEVPFENAAAIPADERARVALEATRRVLARLE